MAEMEKYENLPGVKVTYEDGNLFSGNSRLQASTQRMLIIGSGVDGPVGVPFSVREQGVKAAEKLFGGMIDRRTKMPNRGSLVRSMYEAIRAGNDDIVLLRVDGGYARTEMKAKDVARSTEQFLGEATGNTAFGLPVAVPAGGKFVAVTKVEEVDKNGNATNMAVNLVMDYTDVAAGSEKVYFFANKFRPGNTVRVTFDYETRNYTLVPASTTGGVPDYSDPDYTLNRDTQINRYFYSSRKNWSDKLESGHIPVVVVKDNATGNVHTISSTTPSGDYIYRVGKGQVANPLTDAMSAQDYKDGGIFFTSAYDAEVAKGTYPDINGNVTVTVEYAWYSSLPNQGTADGVAPGQSAEYKLNYTPTSNGFEVYFVQNGIRVELVEGTDYGLSLTEGTVTVNAGAAPAGVQLFASYKTSASTVADPVLVVEGKYAGSLYGTLEDRFDKASMRGVMVKVLPDPSDVTGFEKIIKIVKPDEKRLTYKDTLLEYRTAELTRIKTLRQFVNFVNNDPMNNVVTLSCKAEFGDVPVQGLLVTGLVSTTDNDLSKRVENGFVCLGEVSPGVVKEDLTADPNSEARFPWLGRDGLFDVNHEQDMQKYFEKLGGKYEMNEKAELVLVEQGIYHKLENYVTDVIVLTDVYANTPIDRLVPEKNFATQLAQFCAVVTAKTWETIGVIGVAPAPNSDLLSVQAYINELTQAGMNEHYMYNEATLEYVLNEDGDRIDIGRYVQVVFGPEIGMTNEKIGNYVASGAASYAGLITTLSAEVATTNRVMDVIKGLRYDLSEAMHNQLVGGRYVTFQEKVFGNGSDRRSAFVVKDGVTAALATSDYSRLSTLRIVHSSVQLVRQKADPFIGLPNGLAQRNALSAEIQAGLDRLKELGVLQRFKFVIYSSVQDRVLGNAFITLELVPQFETRKFNTSVVLKAA